jgi:hypothetical protein
MAGAKETPRQRMIAMMYLVMMALLALNVSKDVINAFVVVDENILETNVNFSQKLQDIYTNFEKNYQLNQIKVQPFWEKAKEAKLLSREMVKYINYIRNKLISKTEGISIDSAKNISVKELRKKDNYTIPTNYFMGNSDDGSDGVSKELKDKINEYRQKMLKLVDPKNLDNVNLGLTTEGPYYNADGKELNWETYFFYNTILAADIPSDEYYAEIIVAAYDTTQSPEVYYSKDIDYLPVTQYKQAILLDSKPGKIIINLPARSEGIKKYAGFVRAKTGTGIVNDYHFNTEYVVAKPSYTISAKKMNVFYIGVGNPVSISISGIPKENLTPSISCGTIKRDPFNDDWIVNIPPGFTEAIINISANINGVKREIGSKKFRVKKLPDPIATIANKNSGVINREIMIAAGTLSPKMPADFEFDHSFVISSFTMTIQRGFKVYHFNSNNSYLTDEMIEQIKRTNRGQNIVFENIVARDPDGIDRSLSPIVLTIN